MLASCSLRSFLFQISKYPSLFIAIKFFGITFDPISFDTLCNPRVPRSMQPNEPSDAELLAKAHGVDVLAPAECLRLTEKAKQVQKRRTQTFFNARDGWLLRRIVRGHVY